MIVNFLITTRKIRAAAGAYEIRELITGNLKPINVSNQKWDEIKGIIQQMENNNQFINY